jgi:hypothetical protein
MNIIGNKNACFRIKTSIFINYYHFLIEKQVFVCLLMNNANQYLKN